MKTKISIPVETLHLLPYDREYSKAEAMIQVVFDIETQSEWSSEGYAKQFSWSRTKVENFLEKKTAKGSLKEQLERHRKLTNKAPLRDIKDRKNAFYWSCAEYVEKYGKENIRNFFDYWTELNQHTKKMRFEEQTYFEVGKRLATANRLIFGKNGNIDKVQQEADELLKYAKKSVYPVTNENIEKFIVNSKKSKEVKKYALTKI